MPLLGSFRQWLLAQKAMVLPKSPIMVAINYLFNQWDALNRYTADGDLHIGRVERWRGCLGGTHRLPALSSAGASLVPPCPVSTSRSSNRTCRSPASGSHSNTQAFTFGAAVRRSGIGKSPNSSYR